MNFAVHNPEFSDGYSITQLLSRVTTQANRIVDLTSQNTDFINQNADLISKIADLTKQIVDLTKEKQRQKSNLPRKRLLFYNVLKDSNEVQSWIAPTVASHHRAMGYASPMGKKTRTRKSGEKVCTRNQDANPAVNQATRGIPSSRLITRTRLLVSCRNNVQIVRPNSHLVIQRIITEDRFYTLRSIIETARKQGWDVLEILQTPPDKLIQMIKSA